MIDIGIHKLYKTYGYKIVLDHINLEIKKRDRVALIGKNGCGKSTLLKIIAKEEYQDQGDIYIRKNASIGYLEQIPEADDDATLVFDILMINFIDILNLKSKLTIFEKQMAENTDGIDKILEKYSIIQNQFISLGGYEIEEKIAKISTRLKITHLLDVSFNQLSGGEKTIVKLASTLLKEPDILLLDEPTNHLDMETLDWLEIYLKQYPGTIVLVSHDRYFVDRIANKTILLEKGNITEFHGNYSFTLKQQETLLLLEFEKYKQQQKKIEAMKEAIKRYRIWGNQGDNEKFFKKAHELEKRLEKIDMLDKPELERKKIPMHFNINYVGKNVVRVKNLSFSFDQNQLFNNITFTIFHNQKVALIGNNGTGKSTLLSLLLNPTKEIESSIILANTLTIGYIPQVITFDNLDASILETFNQGCPSLLQQARFILSKYGFYNNDVFKKVGTLSGGEKMLLKLAILLQNQINFLVLDEPTNHIDLDVREMLEESLLDYQGTLLFVSHDRYFIEKVANRILEIKDQNIISHQGTYLEYITKQ